MRLVRARADALRREVPYAYLGELLAARYSPEGAPRDFASLVAAMVAWGVEPSVAEGIGAALGPPDIARHDPALARARLVEGLSVSLARDTERLTVVLADDAHWADTPSLAVLAAAVAKASERFVFIGFSRLGASGFAAPPFADLGLREVRVGKLTPRAAEALVRAVAPDLSLPSLALRPIVEVADGNPLYLEELARSALSGPFEGLRAEGSLLTILQARCVAVGAVERRVLRAASVLGESFEETELVDVLDVLEPAVVREALSELERQELLARRVDEGPRRFRHALVRDAAYSLLTEQELVAFHGRAFDVLSGRGIGSAAELARHAEGAGRLEIASTQWVRSAEEWLAANDMARTIEMVRRALACAGPEVAAEAKVLGSVAAFFAGDIPLSFAWGIEGIVDAPRESPGWLRCVGYLMAVVGHLRPPRRPEPLERAIEHLVTYEPPPNLVVRAAEATALSAQVLSGLRVADLALARACVARLVSLARSDASPEARGWIAFGLGWSAHYAGIAEATVVELASACHGAFREVEDTRNLVAAELLWARGARSRRERGARRVGRGLRRPCARGGERARRIPAALRAYPSRGRRGGARRARPPRSGASRGRGDLGRGGEARHAGERLRARRVRHDPRACALRHGGARPRAGRGDGGAVARPALDRGDARPRGDPPMWGRVSPRRGALAPRVYGARGRGALAARGRALRAWMIARAQRGLSLGRGMSYASSLRMNVRRGMPSRAAARV